MPGAIIFGRRKFKVSTVEPWLVERGFIREVDDGCTVVAGLDSSRRSRAIGAQMGWSEKAVESLLHVHGHIDLIALAEVDALYADNVVPLHAAAESGANPTHGVAEAAS